MEPPHSFRQETKLHNTAAKISADRPRQVFLKCQEWFFFLMYMLNLGGNEPQGLCTMTSTWLSHKLDLFPLHQYEFLSKNDHCPCQKDSVCIFFTSPKRQLILTFQIQRQMEKCSKNVKHITEKKESLYLEPGTPGKSLCCGIFFFLNSFWLQTAFPKNTAAVIMPAIVLKLKLWHASKTLPKTNILIHQVPTTPFTTPITESSKCLFAIKKEVQSVTVLVLKSEKAERIQKVSFGLCHPHYWHTICKYLSKVFLSTTAVIYYNKDLMIKKHVYSFQITDVAITFQGLKC